jgi:hypothetical protein
MMICVLCRSLLTSLSITLRTWISRLKGQFRILFQNSHHTNTGGSSLLTISKCFAQGYVHRVQEWDDQCVAYREEL